MVYRLGRHLDELRARGERALVVFITAGDAPLSDLPRLLRTLEAGGADVIEVGIPFSDPFGEGPTIQASSQRALDRGTTPGAILDAMGQAGVGIPMLTMGYVNPVMRMGWDEFARRSAAAGASGTIISDLVPDEARRWSEASAANDLDTVFLAAPTSTDQRLDQVAERSTGFVYAVSRTGVTGAENEVPPEVGDLVAKIRARTDRPVCVGFGVSTAEHVRRVCAVADGAVVGSALVAFLHREWGKDGDEV
ncbi:tryptophan synthase subunit alpha, partial [bacterium]